MPVIGKLEEVKIYINIEKETKHMSLTTVSKTFKQICKKSSNELYEGILSFSEAGET